MAATRDLAWRPLPLPSSPALPLLLVSARFAAASYVVRLTDMANIWEESMDGDAICTRSLAENTSIDPSDTPENMAQFLASLVSALDPLCPGHGDTSLGLTPTDAGRDRLTLTVTCPLAGFAPLTWPIHLAKCNPSAVATHLVLPLFQAHHAAKLQIESLLQALGHKDAVVAKLVDKLGERGTGLEQVFPALLGRHKVTRSTADDKVKGLAPFDQHSWQPHISLDIMDGPQVTTRLMQSVFGNSGLERAGVDVQDSLAFDGWWHHFKASRQVTHRSPTPRRLQASPSSGTEASGGDGDDDFQVQNTPPRLRPSTTKSEVADRASPSEPADQDRAESLIPDSYPQVVASQPIYPPVPEEAVSTGLGTIGGKTPSAAAQVQTKDPKLVRAAQPAVDDSETASEASDDDRTASVADSPTCLPLAVASSSGVKRGVIGSIGGMKAERGGTDNKGRAEPPSEAPHPTRERLGVIGNKIGGRSPSSKPSREENKRGRHANEEPHGGVPRESSQERADRRREELKLELERKATAGPAKKKRRF
ncbi:hypothetical protein XA68_11001 [Ophiocordyceps unilateralis]|uniref:Non-homologous end-joining factor 1 n=1 Tax=Ophiocordyceps unilateralis TaxID=268505 RepID=A0A2A9PNL1_OPHUN|nr:hypothetical protein XA68_11001 [Ophiocordyceps unilateralis]